MTLKYALIFIAIFGSVSIPICSMDFVEKFPVDTPHILAEKISQYINKNQMSSEEQTYLKNLAQSPDNNDTFDAIIALFHKRIKLSQKLNKPLESLTQNDIQNNENPIVFLSLGQRLRLVVLVIGVSYFSYKLTQFIKKKLDNKFVKNTKSIPVT